MIQLREMIWIWPAAHLAQIKVKMYLMDWHETLKSLKMNYRLLMAWHRLASSVSILFVFR